MLVFEIYRLQKRSKHVAKVLNRYARVALQRLLVEVWIANPQVAVVIRTFCSHLPGRVEVDVAEANTFRARHGCIPLYKE